MKKQDHYVIGDILKSKWQIIIFKERHEKIYKVNACKRKFRIKIFVREKKNLRQNTLNTREGTIVLLKKDKIH